MIHPGVDLHTSRHSRALKPTRPGPRSGSVAHPVATAVQAAAMAAVVVDIVVFDVVVDDAVVDNVVLVVLVVLVMLVVLVLLVLVLLVIPGATGLGQAASAIVKVNPIQGV